MPVKVKICGVRTPAIVETAAEAGADYVGLVFFAKSPRHLTPALAETLARAARGRIGTVAVLVDPDDALIDSVTATVRPDLLQLHGSETPERVAAIKARAGLPVMKAIAIATAADVAAAHAFAGNADHILFDAKADPGAPLPGGNGVAFDWRALQGFGAPFALSGGLTPETVAAAVSMTGAALVDVSSGVERASWRKRPRACEALHRGGEGSRPGAKGQGIMSARTEPNPLNTYRAGPDERGHFGLYGGRFVAETLMPLILDLEQAYAEAKADPAFHAELADLLTHYGGRPSPLYFAERLTTELGGAKIYFKRDELNHTGSHKINNCLGQIQLARRMGKKRIIAETGAGQHGVAVATVAARFGFPCVIYMGATDIKRQRPNVFRMKLLGAEVKPVTSGSGTLKDAMNDALRDWVANVHDTFYIIGTVAGPHPYPAMVRDFQSVIGRETREQMKGREGRLPDTLVACIGGGSNAMGLFHPFLDEPSVAIYGVEAGGYGLDVMNGHAASMSGGKPGVLHGNRTYLLQDGDGQILEGHSISAGLDYPGVGPEHSWLRDSGRVNYVAVTDKEALDAFQLCTRLEGIIPALEPSHALAYVKKLAPTLPRDNLLVMNMCGRGDKDIFSVAEHLHMEM